MEYSKLCPQCREKQIYSCKKSYLWSFNRNLICKKCSTKESAKYIDRAFQKSKKYRNKMSNSLKIARKNSCNYNSESHREKLRMAKINQIKKLGTQHTFNSKACEFIDILSEKLGLNFQHALNGGEIQIFGYLLDGYDENNNIVFEYDEPKHGAPSVKKRDLIRQKRIIERIHPKMFIRYDEQFDKLYDVISNKEIL